VYRTLCKHRTSVTLYRTAETGEGADKLGLLTPRVHSTARAPSDEVLAYQRHSLRLFTDAVPKSQSLTAKAEYRSDEKHEGLTGWSRGNASDLLGRCLAAQHCCTDRLFPQWLSIRAESMHLNYTTIIPFQVLSNSSLTGHPVITHTQSCWQRCQNNNSLCTHILLQLAVRSSPRFESGTLEARIIL